jgi:hypothetical protein
VGNLVLDGYTQVFRLCGIAELEDEIKNAVDRALRDNPQLQYITSQIAYRDFLRILVSPFLMLRDLLTNEFYNRKIFQASLEEIELAASMVFKEHDDDTQTQFLPLVLKNLSARFVGNDRIIIRRAITYLDTTSRELVFRSFWDFAPGGKTEAPPPELNLFNCLSRNAFVSGGHGESKCLCVLTGDPSLCSRSEVGPVRQDRCLDSNESPIRCCSKNSEEQCSLEAALGQNRAALNRLIAQSSNSNFFDSFRGRAAKSRAKLEELRQEGDFLDLRFFKGATCAESFTEVLMLLECGEDSRLVSYCDEYDVLSRAVGWTEFRIDPRTDST